MIRRSVVKPLPFLGTQKAKRAGHISRLNLNFIKCVLWHPISAFDVGCQPEKNVSDCSAASWPVLQYTIDAHFRRLVPE